MTTRSASTSATDRSFPARPGRDAAASGPRLQRLRTLRRGLVAALAVASTLAVAPGTARADKAADKATAESLFNTAREQLKAQKYAEACPKFAESQRLDPQVGTQLNLAKCYELSGKTASAWAAYKDAAFAARTAGETDRETAALKLATDLEAKLSKLQINAADTPGLIIRRDGDEVGKAVLGTPIAVDPGPHVIDATAPGYSVWTTNVVIAPNGEAKAITIPILQKTLDLPRAGGAAPSGGHRGLGFVIGGGGVLVAAVGGVFGGLAAGAASSAKSDPALCPNDVCSTAGRAKIDSASRLATVSTVFVAVGAAAIVTGAVLVLATGPAKPSKEAEATGPLSARLVPSFAPSGGGMTLLGAF